MGCSHSLKCGGLHHFAISYSSSSSLFLVILLISGTHFRFNAEAAAAAAGGGGGGRQIMVPIGYAKIGSKPPRCERRCNSCSHCEAIQVPTNPQQHNKNSRNNNNNNNNSPEKEFTRSIAYSRGSGDDYSNYKPMSWKCKCGDLIFNP